MNNKKFDKKIMAALRVVLLIVGFLLGSSLALLYLNYDSDLLEDALKIVVTVSCGAVLGVTLLLSARPIALLTLSISRALKKLVAVKKPIEIVGYALGAAFGIMAAFVLYVVLSAVSLPAPLSITLSLCAALVLCFVGALVCSKWLSHSDEALEEEKTEELSAKTEGYILTSGAIAHSRFLEFIGGWLCGGGGKIVVLERSVQSEAESLSRLLQSGEIKTVRYIKSPSECDDVLAYAASKRLAVITGTREESEFYEGKVKALCLDAL